MKLLDLKTSKDFTLSDLKCRLLIPKMILHDSGRVQHIGENRFKFITKDEFYEFSVIDTQDARLLTSMLKQYSYNLAQITGSSNNTNTFSVHIVFFYRADREVKLNIVISQKAKLLLIEKKLISEKNFEKDLISNFILTDGHNDCYAYTSGKYRLDALNQDNDNSYEKAENQESSEVSEPGQSDDYNLKSLKLYGKDFSFVVRLKEAEEQDYLYVETVDTKNRNIPALALRLGKLTFNDERSYVSDKIKKSWQ